MLSNKLLKSQFAKQCRDQWKATSESEGMAFGEQTVGSKQEVSSSGQKINDPYYEDSEQTHAQQVKSQKMIDILVKNKSSHEIMKTKLLIMSTNILCIYKNTYPPIEIGFVEYTIEKGIINSYHRFIDAGDIPIGYFYSAYNHSKTHKIPINDFILASDDYSLIGEEIQQIIAKGHPNSSNEEKIPIILFSNGEQIEQNMGALKWLNVKYKDKYKDKYKNEMNKRPAHLNLEWDIVVLDVADLVFNIFAQIGISRPLAICRSDMTSCSFDYSLNTDCPYHQNLECIDCAIGVAKRLAYMMSYVFQTAFKISITPQHFPEINSTPKRTFLELKHFQRLQIEDDGNESKENSSLKHKSLGIGRGKRLK